MKQLLFILLFTLLTQYTLAQWTKQTIPITKPIVGIEFKDSLKGWAVTSAGSQFDVSYVIYTVNGGTNWILQYTGTDYAFDAFDVVDMNTGYIIGGKISNGTPLLLKTTNAGVNWLNMNIAVGIAFDDIFFPSKDSGFICASNSFAPGLWFTSNGGVSWVTRTSGLIATDVQCLFFMNNNTGWCGTETQHISKTTNAGVNWVNVGNFGESIWSIYFINENTGWAGLNAGKIAYTINSGNNWTIQDPEPYNFLISDLFFYNGSSGYAGIGFPFIYKTVNQGSNWGYQYDSSGSYKFSFIDSSKGWSGDTPGGNHISRTTNGGGPVSYVGIISNYHNIPKSYILSQNYPNPFNSQTIIRFAINKTSYVKLRVFDILGKEKSLWESGKQLQAGTHELSFDAKDLSSGVYFYQLFVSDENGSTRFKDTRKMILVK